MKVAREPRLDVKRRRFILALLIILTSTVSCVSGLSSNLKDRAVALDYYEDGVFTNALSTESHSIGKVFGIIAKMATKDESETVPSSSLPMNNLTEDILDSLSKDDVHILKLGHSSLLLKMYGEYWLVDPIFSERASPVSFAGPKRFQAPPIELDELPPIDRILISHNHYDHLDKATVTQLATANTQFMVPLGVESYLQKWGIAAQTIESFEWWQEIQTEHAVIAFTPAQHFSSRTFLDRDKSLWGSWVIKTDNSRLFFSGDSGYFDGFSSIGKRYGPFDLTFIETGAYSQEWPDMHMLPEKSVQAHIDLDGVTMVPVHNSTFDLAFHPWEEPLERVSEAAQQRGVSLLTPLVGQPFSVGNLPETPQWWVTLQ